MKKIILYTLLFLFVGATQAQNQSSIETFKGFHIGLTGHIELIKGSSYNIQQYLRNSFTSVS